MTSILFFGLLAAGANVIGGLVLVKSGIHRWGERFLKYLVALGAGFMLAAIFIEILPESINLWTKTADGESAGELVVWAMTLLLAGYLAIQFFEHTLAPHFHFGAETHPESFMRPSSAYTAVGGLWIHTFFDGVSIASAFLVNFKVGLLVFIAILLHKMPEGFTVASIMLATGRSTKTALIATAAIGAATLAGVITVAVRRTQIVKQSVERLLHYCLHHVCSTSSQKTATNYHRLRHRQSSHHRRTRRQNHHHRRRHRIRRRRNLRPSHCYSSDRHC